MADLLSAVAALAGLCGCNQIFGLSKTTSTKQADAQYFDAPTDAPFACPPAGTIPRFTRGLHQTNIMSCQQYTRSDDLAIAMCRDLSQGPVDGPLAPVTGLGFDTNTAAQNPKLSPEGDQLYVAGFDLNNFVGLPVRVYDRQLDGSWQRGADLPLDPTGAISTVSRGPDRHLLWWQYGIAGANVEEWSNGSGTWTRQLVHTGSELGVAAVYYVWFGADGLRAIFQGQVLGMTTAQMFYVDRATLTDKFNTAVALPEIPLINDAFVTADCGRFYMSGLDQVFYAQQQ